MASVVCVWLPGANHSSISARSRRQIQKKPAFAGFLREIRPLAGVLVGVVWQLVGTDSVSMQAQHNAALL